MYIVEKTDCAMPVIKRRHVECIELLSKDYMTLL